MNHSKGSKFTMSLNLNHVITRGGAELFSGEHFYYRLVQKIGLLINSLRFNAKFSIFCPVLHAAYYCCSLTLVEKSFATATGHFGQTVILKNNKLISLSLNF